MTGTANQVSARCKNCGAALSPEHQGPCPSCGQTGKEIVVAIGTAIEVDEALPVSWVKTREYLEKRPAPAILWAIVTLGSPFLGLVLVGWQGVIAGLLVSAAGVLLGYYSVIRVREIERGGGR